MYRFLLSIFNRWCRKPVDNYALFLQACVQGDLNTIKILLELVGDNIEIINKGVRDCVVHNNNSCLEYILERYKLINLDDYLVYACKRNLGIISETLVKFGADPKKGVRHTTSNNIHRMLFKYINGQNI
jgi:hypothetical protein